MTTGYDTADRPVSITLAAGATTLAKVTDTRDKDGDLTSSSPSQGAPGAATSYTYTGDQRLATTTASGSTTTDGYDAAGDPTTLGSTTQVFDPAGKLCWTATTNVTSPACASPVTGATRYTYDTDGRRTAETPATGTATGYTWNATGQLTGVTGAAIASYTYDGAGLRASKTVAGTTTPFTWDTAGATPLLLSDGTTDYVYGPQGTPVEQFNAADGSDRQFYLSDVHGSTIALTGSTGAIDATWTYSPWGAVASRTGTASTPILFAGAYTDAETGFLYLQARYYDPATALFLSVDALINLTRQAYLYVADNPLNALDPTGLFDWGLVGTIAGITAGVVGLAAATVATGGTDLPIIGAAAWLDTAGTVLDWSALGTGVVSGAIDCGTDWKSVKCALDGASAMLGGVGMGASHLFPAVEGAIDAVADIASDAFTWGSVFWPDDDDASSSSGGSGRRATGRHGITSTGDGNAYGNSETSRTGEYGYTYSYTNPC